MKHLKLFESFYYGSKDRSKKRVEEILSEWGSELEDLEDLFIWFSDFGYEVELKVQTYGVITKKQRIIVAIENIKDMASLRSYKLNGLFNNKVFSTCPSHPKFHASHGEPLVR
jgi:hypothetical protein